MEAMCSQTNAAEWGLTPVDQHRPELSGELSPSIPPSADSDKTTCMVIGTSIVCIITSYKLWIPLDDKPQAANQSATTHIQTMHMHGLVRFPAIQLSRSVIDCRSSWN